VLEEDGVLEEATHTFAGGLDAWIWVQLASFGVLEVSKGLDLEAGVAREEADVGGAPELEEAR
jgi:hypothetical protein